METQRLRLRQWKAEDRETFRLMGSDPEVMRYFPARLSEKEADDLAQRISDLIDRQGWGFWAVEIKETSTFIGMVGLHRQEKSSGIPETPFVEIGWRLARPYWGNGYASEAARAALRYAFDTLNCTKVFAFTACINKPSLRVMSKLGMKDSGLDFDHPKVPQGHPVQRHSLYVVEREDWFAL